MRKFIARSVRFCGLLIIILMCAALLAAQEIITENQTNGAEKETNLEAKNAVTTAVNLPSKRQDRDAFNRKNEFTVWGGFAPDIPRLFSGSRRSTFGEVGIRYSRRIATGGDLFAIKYQFDAIPAAILSYRTEQTFRTSPTTLIIQRNRRTVYAAGLTPVAFQINFRHRQKIQPFFGLSAGMLFFTDPIPDDRSPLFPDKRGRGFNFTLSGGGGIEYATASARSYIFGFKFHHISNSSTGNINPGFDQNFFYFGYTFKKF